MQPMSMSSEKRNSYEDDTCMYDHEETEESEHLLNELMQGLDISLTHCVCVYYYYDYDYQ